MVKIEGLTKDYKRFRAVDHLSFEVRPGEVYGLLGPNGAGKTTTLRMLATLLTPTGGTAAVAGFDIRRQPLEVRRNLGIVNGGMQVYERLTGREVLEFFAGFYGIGGKVFEERLDWVVGLLGLEDAIGKLVKEMSTGMRQKTVIARAILHQPPVLLLDEATSGLDVFARRALLDFVKRYRDLGKTLIYSTHVMSEAEEVCDRVGFLYGGRLVYEGTTAEAREIGEGSLERAFVHKVQGVVA
ncbi:MULTISPECIES: ABC transporter ATP-binding protein [unclassified Meiothermus]|uniref:ABC transporter ATP-binding protein n=1 Tax=unclassified Meiothermus TaxID=370471 RepID=UPI000D7C4588|nr:MULTISPECIES: ATP-binding cassette domain-containing protein [unclassified Meiothermus]PZA07029.1 ABC transporter ATP-binding protein [Meiothermus sp. Pnk-1]RYM34292.1 ATP-binding cassette domain-containing protein [Meiothermus sp. PNK-Is4]